MKQPPVKDMISFTESWWGAPLDTALIKRMSDSPFKHLEAFRADWPYHWAFSEGWQAKFHQNEVFDLPPLAPGKLRPALRRDMAGGLAGLVLLLYSDSVVVSSSYAAPFSLEGRLWDERGKKENRRIVEYGFKNLMRLRPLVERNLVFFTNVSKNPPWSERTRDGNYGLESALKRRYPEITDDDLQALVGADDAHARLLHLAARREVTLVALNDFENQLYFNASDFAWKMLAGGDPKRPKAKPAHLTSSTLARAAVPDLRTGSEEMAELHDDESLFDEWRLALQTAITMVGDFGAEPDELAEARGILANELTASTTRLRAGLEKTKLAHRLTSGARGFGIGASSALLTSFGDSLTDRLLNVGLGGLLGGAIDVAASSKSATRSARLVDGLVYDFRELSSPEASS